MLYGDRSRAELEDYAEKLFAKSEVVRDKNSRRKLYDELIDKFGIDVSIADDMITFKKDIKEFTSLLYQSYKRNAIIFGLRCQHS